MAKRKSNIPRAEKNGKPKQNNQIADKLPYGKPRRPPGAVPIQFWKDNDFAFIPASDRQGKAALDAKNYVCTLENAAEIRELLAAGRKCSDVTEHIFKTNGQIRHTYGTVYKYVQLYRRFFIKPMELLENGEFVLKASPRGEAGKANGANSYRSVLQKKARQANAGLAEIAILEEALLIQATRIKKQHKTEESMTYPLPNMFKELDSLQKMAVELVNLKADLGFNGYLRVPKQLAVTKTHDMAPRMLQALTDDERDNLKDFGRAVVDLIEQGGVHEVEKE